MDHNAFTVLLVVSIAATITASRPQQDNVDSAKAVRHYRVRRQNGEVVESIFQIPIQTLLAVSKAFSTSIQSAQRVREQFFQATRPTGTSSLTNSLSSQAYKPYKPYSSGAYSSAGSAGSAYVYSSALSRPNYPYSNYNNYKRPRAGQPGIQQQSHAASVVGVSTQSDGSSYRI